MMVSIFLLALTPDSWVIYQGDYLNANPCLSQGSAYRESENNGSFMSPSQILSNIKGHTLG